jgi:ribosomal protein S25
MTERNYDDECGDHGGDGGDCGLAAGWGTDFDSGKCRFHRGTSPDGESHENNGNAEKHALSADPKKYHERQSDEEKEWIFELSETILDRIRRVRGDVDPLDRVLARRIAIKLHIAAKASEYVDETGIVQEVFVEDGGYTKEIPNGIVQELRQYDREILNELKKLGLIDDPESSKAEATQGLISVLSSEANNR